MNLKSPPIFPLRKSIVFARSTVISNMSMPHSRRSAWINLASRSLVCALLGALWLSLVSCTQHYDQKEAERYIIESERQWAESVASGDSSVVERILADDFVGVDPKGGRYGKANMGSDTRDAPKYFAS